MSVSVYQASEILCYLIICRSLLAVLKVCWFFWGVTHEASWTDVPDVLHCNFHRLPLAEGVFIASTHCAIAVATAGLVKLRLKLSNVVE